MSMTSVMSLDYENDENDECHEYDEYDGTEVPELMLVRCSCL